jgi:hypothetical protein
MYSVLDRPDLIIGATRGTLCTPTSNHGMLATQKTPLFCRCEPFRDQAKVINLIYLVYPSRFVRFL